MYWQFLVAVIRRAFQPTVRVTDSLQIIAASASPAVGKLLGIKMPETIGNDVLAYIGAAAVAFIVIRLFWAPYSLWKEGLDENDRLRAELSKPEQLVMVSLAKRQARARTRLMSNIASVVHDSLLFNDDRFETRDISDLYRVGIKLCGKTGTGGVAMACYMRLMAYSCKVMEGESDQSEKLKRVGDLFIEYLHNRIKVEDLLSQLPPNIELEKQP